MRRKVIRASPEHERTFREAWRLRDDVADDSWWIAAYEYAATHKLYADEIDAIGAMLARRDRHGA